MNTPDTTIIAFDPDAILTPALYGIAVARLFQGDYPEILDALRRGDDDAPERFARLFEASAPMGLPPSALEYGAALGKRAADDLMRFARGVER